MKPLLAALIAALIAVVGTSGLALAQAQVQGGCDMPCGTFLTEWGSFGGGDGEFAVQGPTGVAVDGSGNILVADPGNARIQKFDTTGTFLTKWGSPGSGDGEFNSPTGVAVDLNGNVFVGDAGNRRIQKFDSTGTFLTKWSGFAGSGSSGSDAPIYVAVDGMGIVFVTDFGVCGEFCFIARIQKFTNTGTFLTTWGSFGYGDGQFVFPTGIAVDGIGNVFVTDALNDRIQKFDSTGNFLTAWGSTGSGNGQFNGPAGVAVNSSGNVFVAEGAITFFGSRQFGAGTARIQKFAVSVGRALGLDSPEERRRIRRPPRPSRFLTDRKSRPVQYRSA